MTDSVVARPRYMTVAQAAEYLGMTESALRSRIKRGDVTFIRDGNRIRFDRLALDAYMRNRRVDRADASSRHAHPDARQQTPRPDAARPTVSGTRSGDRAANPEKRSRATKAHRHPAKSGVSVARIAQARENIGRPAIFDKPLTRTFMLSARAVALLSTAAKERGWSRSDLLEYCIVETLRPGAKRR